MLQTCHGANYVAVDYYKAGLEAYISFMPLTFVAKAQTSDSFIWGLLCIGVKEEDHFNFQAVGTLNEKLLCGCNDVQLSMDVR